MFKAHQRMRRPGAPRWRRSSIGALEHVRRWRPTAAEDFRTLLDRLVTVTEAASTG